MYLRVTQFKSDPAKIDSGVEFLREKIVPAMKKVPGFVGATCIVDRSRGLGAASTLWDSLEAMNKAELIGQQSRIDSEAATGIEVIDVDRFEVTDLEMSDSRELPSYSRLTSGYGDPHMAERAASGVRTQILPVLKKQPGYRAFAAGINRMTGRAFTVSSWDSPEHREASNAVIASLRQKVSSEEGLYGLQVEQVETVLVEVMLPTKA